jgi:hypothetical protein
MDKEISDFVQVVHPQFAQHLAITLLMKIVWLDRMDSCTTIVDSVLDANWR